MARAAIDREFRRRLLEAPKEAIAEAFGIELPSTLRIAFIEKDPGIDVMLVLPSLVAEAGTKSSPGDAGREGEAGSAEPEVGRR